MRDRHRSDDARSLALAATATVGTPTLGPLLVGSTEGAERHDTAVTPPGYAFGLWGRSSPVARPPRSRTPGPPGRTAPRTGRSAGRWPGPTP